MKEWQKIEAEFFDWDCPYTGKHCEDWECDSCDVEMEERKAYEDFDESEGGLIADD